MILRASHVAPVSGELIHDGFVALAGGRIEQVDASETLPRRADVDYGDAVIVPGFVNAHTHLELSSLHGKITPRAGFMDWLEQLVALVRSNRHWVDAIPSSMARGIHASLAAGVTTVGDISREPDRTRRVLAGSVLRAVSFGEVINIGTQRSSLQEKLARASDRALESSRLWIGISPHAPYTVEPDAMRACAERACPAKLPLTIHLAETEEEALFTRKRSGPFADYLKRLGVWDAAIPAAGMTPVELAGATGLLTPRTIVAHANYVSDADIAMLARSGASVAYCPRTHAAFGHAPHRFGDMSRAGINVCAATDSLATNPSLSVLDELAFLRARHPDLPARQLLAFGTINAARALGLAPLVGSIAPGKAADLAVLPLRTASSAWTEILDTPAPPLAVYASGELQETAESADG